MDLFSTSSNLKKAPLAEQLRPKSLDELLFEDRTDLKQIFEAWKQSKNPGSLMLYGPAGAGKTSLMTLLFNSWRGAKEKINAVDVGIPRLRELTKQAEFKFNTSGEPLAVMVDEVHRLKAPQQDILLPGLENGSILMVAATTENPNFKFSKAFLSRLHMIEVPPLSNDSLKELLKRGLQAIDFSGEISDHLQAALIKVSGGDGRRLLGDLNTVISIYANSNGVIDEDSAIKHLSVDRSQGSESLRVDALSALIKSMRGSDEKASIYYVGLLLEAKEDPEVILRRMMIFTSEDIGNANPHAVTFINAIWEAYLKVGMPEALYSLYHAASYLSQSPKSRRHVEQMAWSQKVNTGQSAFVKVPSHLKNHGGGSKKGLSNLPDGLSEK